MIDDLDTPNCPECLVRMDVEGDERTARWVCSECGLVRLT